MFYDPYERFMNKSSKIFLPFIVFFVYLNHTFGGSIEKRATEHKL